MRRVALRDVVGPVTARVLDDSPATVDEALRTAVALGDLAPYVGEGTTPDVSPTAAGSTTLDVWEALATLGAADVALARAVEPHLDAVTILHQAERAVRDGSTWGVFAAEGPGVRLEAESTPTGWTLTGTKPWCSLAGTVSHALVTAWVDDARRGLFAVELADPRTTVEPAWAARGLQEIPSGPVSFAASPALPIGDPGWYLHRPGFAWGGISVAACWLGGATGVARTLLAAAREPARADDAILLMHLGQVDARLAEGRAALVTAAAQIDTGGPGSTGTAASLLAKRVRTTIADAAEAVLRSVGHALGPAPLVNDPAHAKRVADLELYLRQHHGERDAVSEGRAVRDSEARW